MTDLLRKAIERLSQLPEHEQDAVAAWILEEMESEQRWQNLFAQSHDLLAKMADEALQEYRAGKAELLVPDDL
ncbi:hypothetical protein [Fervidibacter sacchari]|jgi:hypothetical protein